MSSDTVPDNLDITRFFTVCERLWYHYDAWLPACRLYDPEVGACGTLYLFDERRPKDDPGGKFSLLLDELNQHPTAIVWKLRECQPTLDKYWKLYLAKRGLDKKLLTKNYLKPEQVFCA